MRSDGKPLPDLRETTALLGLGLIRTDELPDLAARWLAADLGDTEAVRELAGHDRQDPWAINQLLNDALREARTEPAPAPWDIEKIAVDYVATRWCLNRDTRGAVRTLARVGQNTPEFDLGLFIGLDDEWGAGWGRRPEELDRAAEIELEDRLQSQ